MFLSFRVLGPMCQEPRAETNTFFSYYFTEDFYKPRRESSGKTNELIPWTWSWSLQNCEKKIVSIVLATQTMVFCLGSSNKLIQFMYRYTDIEISLSLSHTPWQNILKQNIWWAFVNTQERNFLKRQITELGNSQRINQMPINKYPKRCSASLRLLLEVHLLYWPSLVSLPLLCMLLSVPALPVSVPTSSVQTVPCTMEVLNKHWWRWSSVLRWRKNWF